MNTNAEVKATHFVSFADSTKADWDTIVEHTKDYFYELPDRVLAHLELLRGDSGGFPVTRLEHCLQSATLAAEAGEDEEYVVCALLHDIGDTLGTLNHADIAATILEPFVSEDNHWIVKHHGIFQGYYFFHHLGMDRNMRDLFAEHPLYERTRLFCERYDNPAFDAKAAHAELNDFEPMVRRVFSTPSRGVFQQVAQAIMQLESA